MVAKTLAASLKQSITIILFVLLQCTAITHQLTKIVHFFKFILTDKDDNLTNLLNTEFYAALC